MSAAANLILSDLDIGAVNGSTVLFDEVETREHAVAHGNGLFAGLSNEGLDVTVVWDGAFVEANMFVIASAAPNSENAFALAEFLADPERQAAFSERTNYGPSMSEAFDYMDDELIERLPNAPSHTAIIPANPSGRADAYEESVDRYTAWLAG